MVRLGWRWLPAAAVATALAGVLTELHSDAHAVVSEHGLPGRLPLDGDWFYRADPFDRGIEAGWAADQSEADWLRTPVPSAWNATDYSEASDAGSVGWYRTDFTVPADDADATWLIRFEGTSYAADVFLNGVPIGMHRGLQTPFELPLTGLRSGANRLVVRVDSRPMPTGEFAPLRKRYFWNFGGVLREVYLRRVESVDISSLLARPRLQCRRCPASVLVRATVRNRADTRRRIRVSVRLGGIAGTPEPLSLGPGQAGIAQVRIVVPKPRLWSPEDPHLYRLRAVASTPDGGAPAETSAEVGLRRIENRGGRIYLNGRPMRLYGVGLHEQWPVTGPVLTEGQRARDFAYLRSLHVNFIRSQTPLHPAALEAADRHGILVWEDIPVGYLDHGDLLDPMIVGRAMTYLAELIARDQTHPSVVVWGIGNENEQRADPPDAALARYLTQMTSLAHSMDPSRLVGAETALLGQQAFAGYRRLDVIGINTFPVNGLYGRSGTRRNRRALRRLLQVQRARYRRQALVVTEAGAETIRRPPRRGGVREQSELLRWQLDLFHKSPALSGTTVWILRDFLVRPDWLGTGQPFDTKGLLTWRNRRKPAFGLVARAYRAYRRADARRR